MTEERPSPSARMTVARVTGRLCLAAVFIGPLLAPLYMRAEPRLLGWPFFYWYQFVWVLLGAALLLGAFALRRLGRRQERRVGARG